MILLIVSLTKTFKPSGIWIRARIGANGTFQPAEKKSQHKVDTLRMEQS